jgi:hypothetical protein
MPDIFIVCKEFGFPVFIFMLQISFRRTQLPTPIPISTLIQIPISTLIQIPISTLIPILTLTLTLKLTLKLTLTVTLTLTLTLTLNHGSGSAILKR